MKIQIYWIRSHIKFVNQWQNILNYISSNELFMIYENKK